MPLLDVPKSAYYTTLVCHLETFLLTRCTPPQDLWEVGIRIELFSMDRPGHAFNNDSFYTVTTDFWLYAQSSNMDARTKLLCLSLGHC